MKIMYEGKNYRFTSFSLSKVLGMSADKSWRSYKIKSRTINITKIGCGCFKFGVMSKPGR